MGCGLAVSSEMLSMGFGTLARSVTEKACSRFLEAATGEGCCAAVVSLKTAISLGVGPITQPFKCQIQDRGILIRVYVRRERERDIAALPLIVSMTLNLGVLKTDVGKTKIGGCLPLKHNHP